MKFVCQQDKKGKETNDEDGWVNLTDVSGNGNNIGVQIGSNQN